MNLSIRAQKIHNKISVEGTKLGDLRKIAKEIKKDHELAMELWSTGEFHSRLLAILIMDPKELTPNAIDNLFENIKVHEVDERLQLTDWLMANQLVKSKKNIALILSWENSSESLKRRVFWYYQGRLRWTGKIPIDNTEELISSIEERLKNEEPEVQWAMNFTAAWIGVFDRAYRDKCIKIGEQTGLYKDEVVAKNCTPNYLPKFIEIEAKKRKL